VPKRETDQTTDKDESNNNIVIIIVVKGVFVCQKFENGISRIENIRVYVMLIKIN